MPTLLSRAQVQSARRPYVLAVVAVTALALAACPGSSDGAGGANGAAPGSAGDLTEATLEISGGAATVTITTGDTGGELYRAEAAGSDTFEAVSTETGDGRFDLDFSFGADASALDVSIYLDPEVLWHLDLSGGASTMTVDLTDGRVGSVDLATGVETFDLTLPAPESEVPITQTGGAASFSVHLPADVAASVVFSGGFGAATVDGTSIPPAATAEAEAGDTTATDRYVVTHTGGLASFTLDRVG